MTAKESITTGRTAILTEGKPLREQDLFGVRPKDLIERMVVRDVVDLFWEVLRYRRLNASLLRARAHQGVYEIVKPSLGHADANDLSQRWATRERAALKGVDFHLASAGLTIDAVMAETIALNLGTIERIDRLLSTAEERCNNALREFDRHRATLAAALRAETEKAEDAEYEEVTKDRLSAL